MFFLPLIVLDHCTASFVENVSAGVLLGCVAHLAGVQGSL